MHIPIKDSIFGFKFFSEGYLSVDFFFVLSGFVIAHAYRAVLLADARQTWPFLIKRFGRLWPLHMTVFAFFLAQNISRLLLYHWYATSSHPPPGIGGLLITFLQQATFLQALLPAPDGVGWNGPSWSISTEFWTYVLFSVVTTMFHRWQPVVKIAIVLGALFIVHQFFNAGTDAVGWVEFFRCFAGFFAGQLVYGLYTSSGRLSRWQKSWSASAASGLEIAVVLMVGVFVSTAERFNLVFAAPVIFSVVIYAFAPELGFVSGILKTAPVQKLGLYSYSIYMVHSLLISSIIGVLRLAEKLLHIRLFKPEPFPNSDKIGYFIHFGSALDMACLALLIIGLVIFVASWTYRLVEKPGQRYFSKIAGHFGGPKNKTLSPALEETA